MNRYLLSHGHAGSHVKDALGVAVVAMSAWVWAGCDCSGQRRVVDADSDIDIDVDADSDTESGTLSDTDSETETGSSSDTGPCVLECEDPTNQTCEDLCRNTRTPEPLRSEYGDIIDPCECFGTGKDLEAHYQACIADCLGPDGLQDGINEQSTDGWDLLKQFCVYEENCHCEKHYGDCGFECPLCGPKGE